MNAIFAAALLAIGSPFIFAQNSHEDCVRRYRMLSDHSAEVDRTAGRAERELLVAFLEQIRPGIFGPVGADSTAKVRQALIQNTTDFPLRLVILKTVPSSKEWTLRHLVRAFPIQKIGNAKDVTSKKRTFSSVSVDYPNTTVLLRAAFEFPDLVAGIVGSEDNIQENPWFNDQKKLREATPLANQWMARLRQPNESDSTNGVGPVFVSYMRRVLEHRFRAKP